MRRFSRILISTDAAEVVELAVVLPLLFTVIFAIFSFARAYNVYSTMTRAAQEAAHVAVTQVSPSGNSVTIPASCSSATNPGQFPPDVCIAQAADDVLTASHLDPRRTTQLSYSGSGTACAPPAAAQSCRTATSANGTTVNICSNTVLNPGSTPQSCGTVVSFQYSYEFLPIPFVNLSSIQIPAQAQMRMEY